MISGWNVSGLHVFSSWKSWHLKWRCCHPYLGPMRCHFFVFRGRITDRDRADQSCNCFWLGCNCFRSTYTDKSLPLHTKIDHGYVFMCVYTTHISVLVSDVTFSGFFSYFLNDCHFRRWGDEQSLKRWCEQVPINQVDHVLLSPHTYFICISKQCFNV